MQNNETARTKSARNKLIVIVVLCVIAVFFASSFFIKANKASLIMGSNPVYSLEVVRSAADQAKGLGGRASLAPNTGMLFWNTTSAHRCFWMKDMQFPIDIIWVSGDRHITNIEHSLSPSTYPKSYCADGQYVIELNAGEATKNNLNVGDQLAF